jgi:hypothetical protein
MDERGHRLRFLICRKERTLAHPISLTGSGVMSDSDYQGETGRGPTAGTKRRGRALVIASRPRLGHGQLPGVGASLVGRVGRAESQVGL